MFRCSNRQTAAYYARNSFISMHPRHAQQMQFWQHKCLCLEMYSKHIVLQALQLHWRPAGLQSCCLTHALALLSRLTLYVRDDHHHHRQCCCSTLQVLHHVGVAFIKTVDATAVAAAAADGCGVPQSAQVL